MARKNYKKIKTNTTNNSNERNGFLFMFFILVILSFIIYFNRDKFLLALSSKTYDKIIFFQQKQQNKPNSSSNIGSLFNYIGKVINAKNSDITQNKKENPETTLVKKHNDKNQHNFLDSKENLREKNLDQNSSKKLTKNETNSKTNTNKTYINNETKEKQNAKPEIKIDTKETKIDKKSQKRNDTKNETKINTKNRDNNHYNNIETQNNIKQITNNKIENKNNKQNIQNTAGNTDKQKQIKIYFARFQENSGIKLESVSRKVNLKDIPLTVALTTLINGPNKEEASNDYISIIPPGTEINNIVVKNNIAYIDLSEHFLYNSYGEEGIKIQINQIIKTALEFPTVKGIKILINGKSISKIPGTSINIDKPLTETL